MASAVPLLGGLNSHRPRATSQNPVLYITLAGAVQPTGPSAVSEERSSLSWNLFSRQPYWLSGTGCPSAQWGSDVTPLVVGVLRAF